MSNTGLAVSRQALMVKSHGAPAEASGTPWESSYYREAAWLAKRYAFTVLPSENSLSALRAI